jgi:hypothetical protein
MIFGPESRDEHFAIKTTLKLDEKLKELLK